MVPVGKEFILNVTSFATWVTKWNESMRATYLQTILLYHTFEKTN